MDRTAEIVDEVTGKRERERGCPFVGKKRAGPEVDKLQERDDAGTTAGCSWALQGREREFAGEQDIVQDLRIHPSSASAKKPIVQEVQTHGSRRDLDLAPLVCDDDDRAAQCDVASEPDVALRPLNFVRMPTRQTYRDSEVVELEHVRNSAEALLEVGDLLERVAKLHDRRLRKHALRVHDELAVLQRVQVAGDQKEIGAALDLRDQAKYISSADFSGTELRKHTGKKRDRGTLMP